MENTAPARTREASPTAAKQDMKPERTARQKLIRFLSSVMTAAVLAVLAAMLRAYLGGQFSSAEAFRGYIEGFGPFGPLFLTVFQSVQVILPVLPGFLGCAVGTAMFGPVVGFLCSYIGISAGSVIAFFLARRYGMPLIRDLFPGGKYRKWAAWASERRSYIAFLFVAMLLPLFPDDYLCYFSGVTEMTAKKFIWVILLGKPWCILAYSLGFSLIM